MEKQVHIPLIRLFANRSLKFTNLVLKNYLFITMASAFVAGKIAVNLAFGATRATALRSGIVGMLGYVFGCFVIHILASDKAKVADHDEETGSRRPGYLYGAMAIYALIAAVITIEILNDIGSMNFQVPLWSWLNSYWSELVRKWMQRNPDIEGIGIFGLPYLILFVLFPAFLIWKSKSRFPKIFGLKACMAALPFVALYALAFIFVRDLSIGNLLSLLCAMFWPALGEEFFYRGVLQKALINATGNPVSGIVLTSLLFAASHIPVYVLAASGPTALAWSSLLPVMFTSFFWGYGYYRTGVLWPWIFIHAASNLAGL